MLEKHSTGTARSITRHARSRLKPPPVGSLRGRQTATTASSTGQLRRLRPRERLRHLSEVSQLGWNSGSPIPGDLQAPRKRLLEGLHSGGWPVTTPPPELSRRPPPPPLGVIPDGEDQILTPSCVFNGLNNEDVNTGFKDQCNMGRTSDHTREVPSHLPLYPPVSPSVCHHGSLFLRGNARILCADVSTFLLSL